ncbi:MAG: DegT/DnrJ/EryC1/StrS family aminotransferase [Fimbriimonadaceae bacterium]|nr:DegT/DnrJ/EryC1/StrS family aminotransferase [Fimbriimonadaceae bacterium]
MTPGRAGRLAVLGGERAVATTDRRIFDWPQWTPEHREAMLAVIDSGGTSEWDVTLQFEAAWAAYNGVEYALAYPNGTAALQAAMFAVGLQRGDEIIGPAFTYWASLSPALTLGAISVFADLDPESLCLDPRSVAAKIGPRTRAIMVVHYNAHPAAMDELLALARQHDLRVIEDVSRAQGSLYRGTMCGALGDVGALSMMARKSFAIGEGGMLVTRDRAVYERAVAWSHYERHDSDLTDPALRAISGIPLGGVKGRLNQVAAACGLVETRHYPARLREIDAALRRFAEGLAGVPGVRLRAVDEPGSSMGGWYYPVVHYEAAALGGLPLAEFGRAVAAEGAWWAPLPDRPLHRHPFFQQADIYGDGQPTRLVGATRDVRDADGDLPVSETIRERACMGPWFKHDWADQIAAQATAWRKVAEQADTLLAARAAAAD